MNLRLFKLTTLMLNSMVEYYLNLSIPLFLKIFKMWPFLKPLLSLLQYCFYFTLVFWPRGMGDLNSLPRDRTHTPYIRIGLEPGCEPVSSALELLDCQGSPSVFFSIIVVF